MKFSLPARHIVRELHCNNHLCHTWFHAFATNVVSNSVMALCSHCAVVWAWKAPFRQDDWEYDERWNNDPKSAHTHHSYKHCSSFAALEASASGGCNLCQLLCYGISLFPIQEYRSRYKLDNWHLFADDVEEFLRGWTGSSEVVLSLFNNKGQSGYGIYYRIGDTGVTGALPFGSTSRLSTFTIGTVNVSKAPNSLSFIPKLDSISRETLEPSKNMASKM